jgi:hypothetical protein
MVKGNFSKENYKKNITKNKYFEIQRIDFTKYVFFIMQTYIFYVHNEHISNKNQTIAFIKQQYLFIFEK